MRLAVGEVAMKLIRRQATAVLDDTERSEAFLTAVESPG